MFDSAVKLVLGTLVGVALVAAGCNTTAEADTGEQEALIAPEKDSIKIDIEGQEEQVQTTITGVTEDPNRFPAITLKGDSTLYFEAFNTRFTLRHDFPLVPVTNDKLSWIEEDNFNEQNGVYVTYVVAAREIKLAAANVRVDYITKDFPSFGSADSALLWVDDFFIVPPESREIRAAHTVTTESGKPAYCKEVFSVRKEGLSGKFIAFAYLDASPEHLVGFNLTAVDSFEYKDALPAFYDLVKSYGE
ncbi:MAG: hypothetical protein AAGI38_15040 [Bacteroidota bacterium]